jgi:hypothetical protein
MAAAKMSNVEREISRSHPLLDTTLQSEAPLVSPRELSTDEPEARVTGTSISAAESCSLTVSLPRRGSLDWHPWPTTVWRLPLYGHPTRPLWKSAFEAEPRGDYCLWSRVKSI